MPSLGFGEFVVICFIAVIYAIPIGIAVWAIITLKRIRSGQQALMNKMEAIERSLLNRNQ